MPGPDEANLDVSRVDAVRSDLGALLEIFAGQRKNARLRRYVAATMAATVGKQVANHLNGDAEPGTASQVLFDAKRPQTLVNLALRRRGRLLHEQWSAAEGFEQAIASALRCAGRAIGQDAYAQADVAQICLCYNFQAVNTATPSEVLRATANSHRGVRGIILQVAEQLESTTLVSPLATIATNRKFAKIIDSYCQEHYLDSEVKRASQLRLWTFDAAQVLVDLTKARNAEADAELTADVATPLFRGTLLVNEDQVDRDLIVRLEQLLGDYLIRSVQADGRMRYVYYPSRGTEDLNRNNQIRQWMASLALCRVARFRDDLRLDELAARNIRFNLEHVYQEQAEFGLIDERGQVKLGAVALAALALGQPSHHKRFAVYRKKLLATVDHLWQENGKFQTFFRPADRDEFHNFYPGEALLAWSQFQLESPDDVRLARFMQSFEYYSTWHRENRNPAFIPWHTQACFSIWQATRNPALAAFIFEMNDWLVGIQQWEDAPHLDCRGRFYDPQQPFGPPHASSTGVYLEGLIDAFRLARAQHDLERAAIYRKAIRRGLRSLTQLTFKDDVDMFYASKRNLLRGGVRTTVYDNVVRIDNVQHNLLAILKLLEVDELVAEVVSRS